MGAQNSKRRKRQQRKTQPKHTYSSGQYGGWQIRYSREAVERLLSIKTANSGEITLPKVEKVLSLKQLCEQKLEQQINLENVCEKISLAARLNAESLKNRCIALLVSNYFDDLERAPGFDKLNTEIKAELQTIRKLGGVIWSTAIPVMGELPKGSFFSRDIRLAVAGPAAAGKSSLLSMLLSKFFSDSYDPTIEDYYRKTIQLSSELCTLSIVEAGGQDAFSANRDAIMRSYEVFMFVFDVNNASTFEELVACFYPMLLKVKDVQEYRQLVLVGTKIDLAVASGGASRQVSMERAIDKAKEWRVPYVETSAKLNANVDTVFAIAATLYTEYALKTD